ncbi:TauD/TfdA family dioxygenase [Nocardia sp. NPDC057353]|uniref:TauD/TfdA family dioxygenase n=1 Tax=Nocardia sp. NPDC057353 TaxID=3346104 RepID=UPI00362695D3
MKSVLSERSTFHPQAVERREIPPAAGAAIRAAADAICVTLGLDGDTTAAATLTDPRIVAAVRRYVPGLPGSVAAAVRPPSTSAGATIVGGLPVRDAEIGATPQDWRAAAGRDGAAAPTAASLRLDISLLLLAAAAGEPFGWRGQQGGRLVNNIVPAAGHEHEQSGASSSTLLTPHTEDAFHPERAHLLLLGCLRNHDMVGTTVSSVRQVELTAAERRTLAEPVLPILPDVSYGDAHDRAAAPALPTLWHPGDIESDGAAAELTTRYDPAYTPLDDAGAEYRRAYARLGAELERVCRVAALAPGELLLVDNDVAVHGRVPFTARYDGTDRWLKRVNIRLPERRRRAAENRENGYGQQIVAPFRTVTGRDTSDDRGSDEQP